jgi:hypothetical protein
VARRKLAMEVTPLCLASAKIRKAYTEGRAMQGYAGLLRINAFRGDPASSEFDWNFLRTRQQTSSRCPWPLLNQRSEAAIGDLLGRDHVATLLGEPRQQTMVGLYLL